jgi:hypothetical protein
VTALLARLRDLPWSYLVLACLTLGLAPFRPEPHVVEKLGMLVAGTLTAPLDVFDLLLHAAPWLLLGLKGLAMLTGPDADQSTEDRR